MTSQISQHELDKLHKCLITDGGKPSKVLCNDPSVPPIVFDSEESEEQFLAQLNEFYGNLPQPELDGSSFPSEGCHMSEEPPTTIIEKPDIDTDLDEPLPERKVCDGETCESCQ